MQYILGTLTAIVTAGHCILMMTVRPQIFHPSTIILKHAASITSERMFTKTVVYSETYSNASAKHV